MLVDSDCAVLGGFDARVLKPQPLGGRFTPGCDHHVIHLKVLGRTLGVQVVHGHGVGVIGNGLYANARVSGNALVGDNLACRLGDIVIVTPEKRGSAFKQGYFGAVGGENTGELDTNRTPPIMPRRFGRGVSFCSSVEVSTRFDSRAPGMGGIVATAPVLMIKQSAVTTSLSSPA